MPARPPAVLLLGPTASGKTACALAIAERLPAEIISVDSALVYRGMDIGTAKPDAAERARCPHHLIDIIEPEDAYSAARFCTDVTQLVVEIANRGHVPVLAGGTMLYFKALRDGLSDLPRADAAVRGEIDAMAARDGWPAVHATLAGLDPAAAARLDPNDAQRIQRALEIVRLTGRPLAESYARHARPDLPFTPITIALAPSRREVLHARIAERFDVMLANGFIEEVVRLRARPALSLALPAMRCVGYRQVWEWLDGAGDRAGMRDRGIFATRQLAKRQITWMRKFREDWADYTEIDCLSADLPARVAARVAESVERHAAPGADQG
ncbi:MAG: tRNA (adenosine(37)-N6)-dimethylallyltransferase MiaA [Rhodocyclaceae bacterium]|nr:tRNA (adenosine(37)-N6)-dimethylallyltransferase MiaA [Rhodocyclaceae bacterium]